MTNEKQWYKIDLMINRTEIIVYHKATEKEIQLLRFDINKAMRGIILVVKIGSMSVKGKSIHYSDIALHDAPSLPAGATIV